MRIDVAKQNTFWSGLAESDPDRAVIDFRDVRGKKNSYICQLRNHHFLANIRPSQNARVLDFGCGSGILTEFADQHGHRAFGTDINFDLLRHARHRRRNNPLAVVQMDGITLPFQSGSFDSIVTYVVLNYLPSVEALTSLLAEFRRVLAPEGRVVAIEQTARRYRYSEEGQKHQHTIADFKRCFTEAGFSDPETQNVRYSRFPTTYLVRYGLLPASVYGSLIRAESWFGKRFATPSSGYSDTLFIANRQG